MGISVIIPVYNVEKFVKRSVESALNQTYKDLEIILVNDGSTDKSGEICDNYAKKDKRIKVIHQENKGISGARRIGFLNATKEYLSFLDSDDFILADFYETLFSYIDIEKADIIIGRQTKVSAESLMSASLCKTLGTNTLPNDLLDDVFPVGYLDRNMFFQSFFTKNGQRSICGIVFNKDIINKDFFKDGLSNSEDLYFWLQLFKHCIEFTALKVPCQKYMYVLRKESVSNSVVGISKHRIDINVMTDWLYVRNILLSSCLSYGYVSFYKNYFLDICYKFINGDLFFLLKKAKYCGLLKDTIRTIRRTPKEFLRYKPHSIRAKSAYLFAFIFPRIYLVLFQIFKKLSGKENMLYGDYH